MQKEREREREREKEGEIKNSIPCERLLFIRIKLINIEYCAFVKFILSIDQVKRTNSVKS